MCESIPDYAERELVRFGPEVRRWYETVRHRVTETLPGELSYGSFYPGLDPREWYPDLQTNTDAEVEAWSEACQRWELGEPTVSRPSNPDHPFGCIADHSFGLGVHRIDMGEE